MGIYMWVNFVFGYLAIIIVIIYLVSVRRKMELVLPPTPPGWPFLGHLPLLKRPLHRSLHTLAQGYGPLLYLNMGSVPTVVVSSSHWAKVFLHTHERDFSDRPSLEAGKRLFYNTRTLVLMQHGPLWRELRKLYTVQMLAMRRIEMFEEERQEEVEMAMKVLQQEGGGSDLQVEMRKLVFGIVGNMMTRMLFSRRLFGYGRGGCRGSCCKGSLKEGGDGGRWCRCRDQKVEFGKMIEEMAVLFGAPVAGDYFPCIGWLDMGGYKQRMKTLASQLDAFLEDILTARLHAKITTTNNKKNEMDNVDNSSNSNYCNYNMKTNEMDNVDLSHNNKSDEDFLSLLITLYHDNADGKECIKAILLDMLSAGTETTAITVEWAMAELLRNPLCMSKLQEELALVHHSTKAKSNKDSRHVSTSTLIRDVDLPNLTYLQAVIKETLRLHPPLPIVVRQLSKSLPHGKDVCGYNLPKKTRLLVNVWALGRDTATWGENPTYFCPDKFLGPSPPVDFRGQHFELLPFGSGRRGCPGMNLGLSMVGLVLANLINFYDWKLPYGYKLDLVEAPSRTAPMAKPLLAIPIRKISSMCC